MNKIKAYTKVSHIKVYIWEQLAGVVALDPKLGYYVFSYDVQFGKSGIELAPLHMPLNDQAIPYVFTDLPELTYKRLPALLADALPDDFGNALIDRYMASQGIAPDQITILDRLAYMGKRPMGALEFKPAHGLSAHKPIALEMNQLVSEARNIVHGTLRSDNGINAALKSIIEVGTSAGGARAKAVVAWNPTTHEIRSGDIDVPQGFEHWLLKFDGMGVDKELGSARDYGRIEYAYYLMAKAAGITIAESRILEENGRAHFMTKRFDRESGHIKHHIQTLCAMNHIDYKKKSTNSYEQLFMTIRALRLDRVAETEAFRRMVFNVMGRNCDDHTKNISFMLKQGGSWELAPAYDLTYAYNPHGEWTNQHLMSVNNKFDGITHADLIRLANRFGIGEASEIIKSVREAIGMWPYFAKTAGVNKDVAEKIQKLLNLINI